MWARYAAVGLWPTNTSTVASASAARASTSRAVVGPAGEQPRRRRTTTAALPAASASASQVSWARAADDTSACVGSDPLLGQPGARLGGVALAALGQAGARGRSAAKGSAFACRITTGVAGRVSRASLWHPVGCLHAELRRRHRHGSGAHCPGRSSRSAAPRTSCGAARCSREFVDARRWRRRPDRRDPDRVARSAPRSSRCTTRSSASSAPREVVGARPETREEADDPELVERLDDATGIFMTGGNQLKLSAIVNGTAFGDAIKAAHAAASSSAAPPPAPASSPRTWSPSAPAARPRSSG